MLPRRLRVIAAAALVITLGATVSATAAPAGAPTDTASAFTTGFLAGDARVCGLASADVQALLAQIMHTADCASAMAVVRQGVAADAEVAEKAALQAAHKAALVASVDHHITLGGKAWFGKHFPLAALARAIHTAQPGLRIRLGAGPAAARSSAANVVVVDAKRSTPKRLVLYGESKGGAIWQLSASPTSKPSLTRSTVPGVAAPAPAPSVKSFALAPAAPGDSTLVVTSLLEAGGDEPTELLLPVGPDGLVQSFLVGRAIVPPAAGTGASDAAAFAAALTAAYSSTEQQALCGLFDPALVSLLGGECSIVGKAAAAADVTTPAQRVATADGTTLVAVKLGDAPNQLTTINLAVPTGTGYRVAGIFFDIGELMQLIDRPI